MRIDAGIGRRLLRHLFAQRAVARDAVHADAARIVVGDQHEGAGAVDAEMDRARAQRRRRAMRRERAGRGIDAPRRRMVLVAGGAAETGGAVARGDIEDRQRRMAPGVLHIGRHRRGTLAGERAGVDIDVIERQIRPDAGIEHSALRFGLRPRQPRRGKRAGEQGAEAAAADQHARCMARYFHRDPPSCQAIARTFAPRQPGLAEDKHAENFASGKHGRKSIAPAVDPPGNRVPVVTGVVATILERSYSRHKSTSSPRGGTACRAPMLFWDRGSIDPLRWNNGAIK